MAVQEAGSKKIADHYFAVEEQIKLNEGIPAILKKIYEGEFTKQQMKFSSIISETLGEIYDDQQFLKVMDQETKESRKARKKGNQTTQGKQTTMANQEKHGPYHTMGLFIQQNRESLLSV